MLLGMWGESVIQLCKLGFWDGFGTIRHHVDPRFLGSGVGFGVGGCVRDREMHSRCVPLTSRRFALESLMIKKQYSLVVP